MDTYFTNTADTPQKVCAEAMRLNQDGKLALIMVDYLQLMGSERRAESKHVETDQISRALKALAMELDIPVFPLSQLNRTDSLPAVPSSIHAVIPECTCTLSDTFPLSPAPATAARSVGTPPGPGSRVIRPMGRWQCWGWSSAARWVG